jgi:lipopolysaccharide transport system ATP-binding protein
MSDIILKVENVSKLYRLGTVGTGTFGGDVQRFWKTKVLGQEDPFLKVGQTNDRTSKEKAEFVWSLKDINFEVNRGEVLGIIGKNGAGKSTLLKLLSRITSPTTGSIKSAGRMASLLEVGTGFHPELTGRENIFLNGAILGMTKKEIQKKFDEIVDFSGCQLYIDTPTKRYSSGMTVRLGFAVAAFLDPEILIVDEVLAVGDAEFQNKAIGKMKEVSKGEGRTVLFVSHNMQSIRALCTRGILLKNGSISFTGDIDATINNYSKTAPTVETNVKNEIEINNYIIRKPIFYDGNQKQLDSNKLISPFAIRIMVEMKQPEYCPAIGVVVINNQQEVVFKSSSKDCNEATHSMSNNKYILGCSLAEILNLIAEGEYTLCIELANKENMIWSWQDSPYKINFFNIPSYNNASVEFINDKRLGYIKPLLCWDIKNN